MYQIDMEDTFDDKVDKNVFVEFGINDKVSDCCTQYVKRSKIRKTLLEVIEGVIEMEIEYFRVSYYFDYIYDIEDDVINAVYSILSQGDVVLAINTLKRLKRVPNWAKNFNDEAL